MHPIDWQEYLVFVDVGKLWSQQHFLKDIGQTILSLFHVFFFFLEPRVFDLLIDPLYRKFWWFVFYMSE